MKSSRNIISVDFEDQNYIFEKEEKGKLIYALTRKSCKNKAEIGSVWLFEQFEEFQALFFFVLSTS